MLDLHVLVAEADLGKHRYVCFYCGVASRLFELCKREQLHIFNVQL